MADIFESFGMDKAKALLDGGLAQAQELIADPAKANGLLVQIEQKLKEVPVIGETLSDVPLMISMIKNYITRQYGDVSPKVIALMVSSMLYLLKKKDIISDNIPVLGLADDIAVIGLALKLCEPELTAYKEWRDGVKRTAPETAAPSGDEIFAEKTDTDPEMEPDADPEEPFGE